MAAFGFFNAVTLACARAAKAFGSFKSAACEFQSGFINLSGYTYYGFYPEFVKNHLRPHAHPAADYELNAFIMQELRDAPRLMPGVLNNLLQSHFFPVYIKDGEFRTAPKMSRNKISVS